MNLFIQYLCDNGLDPKTIKRDEMLAYGHTAMVSASGKTLGSIKSERKAKTSRENGKKGWPPDYTKEFEMFWKLYPRHVAKPIAFAAFKKVQEDSDSIIEGVKNWKSVWKEEKYIPHPATFLNQRRWEDEVSAVEEIAFIDLTKK